MPSTPDMPVLQDCLDKLLERLKATLDLSTPPVSEEYAYQSLPLCVLDTIFSINAKYESTRKVVIRYCDHYGLQRVRKDPDTLPPIEDQESLSAFTEKITSLGVEEFAKTILANRQRTSTRNGISKSEAVLRFAQVLQAHKVEYLQDVEAIQGKESFEKAVKEIPGQGSGITIRYFYMLAGSDDFVKPDRMVLGFLKEQTGRSCNPDQAQELLGRAANALRIEYPYMTPKLLDNLIWMYQREKGKQRGEQTSALALQELPPIEVKRRKGNEFFHHAGKPLWFDLLSFWQWSSSDIVSNATRGVIAEYIVAQALGIATGGIREEWAKYDLKAKDGTRIEVKSAAYIQSWRQRDFSTISFLVPKTRAWDKDTNLQSKESQRQADVYVFALLAHKEQSTLDPMDLSQWEFYVLPTSVLDNRTRSQHSITLPSLRNLAGAPVSFYGLEEAVKRSTQVKLGE